MAEGYGNLRQKMHMKVRLHLKSSGKASSYQNCYTVGLISAASITGYRILGPTSYQHSSRSPPGLNPKNKAIQDQPPIGTEQV